MEINAEIKPTENPEKLKRAVKKLFSGSEPKLDESRKEIEAEANFSQLWEKLKKQRIRDSVIELLRKNKTDGETHLDISKTPAYAGKVSVYAGSSIGKITLHIDWKEAEDMVQEYEDLSGEDKN